MNLKKRKRADRVFYILLILSVIFTLTLLVLLFSDTFTKGITYINADFFNNFSSRFPNKSGIRAALFGSLYTVILSVIIAAILGIGTAIYLEEYAPKNKFTDILKVNISNLAGIPSVIYGILGLALFVRYLDLGRTIISGALTLALLILPTIIVASQEALKTVPKDMKEGSYALGATKWQTIKKIILPYSFPGILTGMILAVSRAFGESAPLVVIGGAASIWFQPKSVFDEFTTLPLQIFNWAARPQAEFQNIAAAGIIVLIVLLVIINLAAILVRNKYQDRM